MVEFQNNVLAPTHLSCSYMKDQVFVSLEGGVMYAVSRAPGKAAPVQ